MTFKDLKIMTLRELQVFKGADEAINAQAGPKLLPVFENKWILADSLANAISERQAYCDEHIVFWKDKPEIAQVWVGIKQELERLKEACIQ